MLITLLIITSLKTFIHFQLFRDGGTQRKKDLKAHSLLVLSSPSFLKKIKIKILFKIIIKNKNKNNFFGWVVVMGVFFFFFEIFFKNFNFGWVGFSMKTSHETTITTEMLRLSQQTRRKH
jgi:hypothetical protein